MSRHYKDVEGKDFVATRSKLNYVLHTRFKCYPIYNLTYYNGEDGDATIPTFVHFPFCDNGPSTTYADEPKPDFVYPTPTISPVPTTPLAPTPIPALTPPSTSIPPAPTPLENDD